MSSTAWGTSGPECPNIKARILEVHGQPGISLWLESGRTQTTKDHGLCNTDRCIANDSTTETRSPRHTTDYCKCDFLGPDPTILRRLLNSESPPLVRFDGHGSGAELSLDACGPGMPFVSISHASSDGLRNPRGNTLPSCQVERLFAYAAKLWSRVGCNPRAPVRIWIDTLCMPPSEVTADGVSDSSARTMARVGDLACAVLVIDSDIYTLSAESEYSTIAARLLFSSWNSRLWTLYEALRAKTLYFQFNDNALSLELIEQKQRFIDGRDSCHMMLGLDDLRSCMCSYPADHDKNWPALKRMLKGRRTSYVADIYRVFALLLWPSHKLQRRLRPVLERTTSMSDSEVLRLCDEAYRELRSEHCESSKESLSEGSFAHFERCRIF